MRKKIIFSIIAILFLALSFYWKHSVAFLTQHNEWTLPLFIASIAIDLCAARRVDANVHNAKLYLVLIATILINVIINFIYYIDESLYNISPISSGILIVLLCKVLVDIYVSGENKMKRILSGLVKTQKGKKKEVCAKHYERITIEDFKDACKDCPLLEK